jgi:hypothetical protein
MGQIESPISQWIIVTLRGAVSEERAHKYSRLYNFAGTSYAVLSLTIRWLIDARILNHAALLNRNDHACLISIVV